MYLRLCREKWWIDWTTVSMDVISHLNSCNVLIIKTSLKSTFSDRKWQLLWWAVINCCNLKTCSWQSCEDGSIIMTCYMMSLSSSTHRGVKDLKTYVIFWSSFSFFFSPHRAGLTSICGQDCLTDTAVLLLVTLSTYDSHSNTYAYNSSLYIAVAVAA